MRRALKTKLAGITEVNSVVSGVFTPPIPDGVNYPIVTIQRVDEDSQQHLGGVSGMRRELWQVDVYAAGAGAWTIVDAICAAIKSELDGATGETWSGKSVLSCWFDEGRDLVEEEISGQDGIARRQQDYRITYKTT